MCHTDTPAKRVEGVRFDLQICEVSKTLRKRQIWLSFLVDAEPSDVYIPAPARPHRTDELWKTTCFEIFLQRIDGTYVELNFSPSSRWAAYSLTSHRDGIAPLDIDPPIIRYLEDDGQPYISITVDLPKAIDGTLGVSAVIEETDGTKSYWALRHALGPPDFHHPDCFALTLPSPEAP